MDEQIDIILSAIDDASDTFQSVADSATEMGDALQTGAEQGSSGLGDVEEGADTAGSALESMANLQIFEQLSGYVTQVADTLWDLADRAGSVSDSWTRVGLAAEGAGINIDDMKDSVTNLASETGRAGGSVRESFIQMSGAGIENLSTMETLFKGASAQAFILGTDVDGLVNKFSGMAMKSSIAERTLKGTGITVEELGEVLGIQGATIDDVNAKWETMDTDARAAALGQAAAMNEGEQANDEYKKSWEGLQTQIDIAKGKLAVMIGNVLLPVLIPALEAAAAALQWLGDIIGWVMDSPLGGFVSILGVVAGAIAIIVPAIAAMTAAMGFLEVAIIPAITASWALLAPWLPFIAAAVLIVGAIYAIGNAFGWWDDLGGMMDAFYNNVLVPIYEFLVGVFTPAWNFLMQVIAAITPFVNNVTTAFSGFMSGQLDLPGLIWSVMTNIASIYTTIWTMILTLLAQWGSQMLSKGRAYVTQFVNGIVSWLKSLPGKVYNVLLGVVGRITGAIGAWISAASSQVSSVVSAITSPFSGVAGAISGALGGVVGAITAPFKRAWENLKPIVDKIKGAMKIVQGGWGGEEANGRESLLIGAGNKGYTVDNSPVKVEQTLTLDFQNVPSHISTSQLISALTDRNVLDALTSNSDFQTMDNRVKQRILLKNNRAGGI